MIFYDFVWCMTFMYFEGIRYLIETDEEKCRRMT
jgi:hypothetical protein